MKIEFITVKNKELQNLLWEIESRKMVLGFGLKTILPPEDVILEYEELRNASGREKVRDYFDNIYKKEEYLEITQKISDDWRRYETGFFEALKIFNKFSIPEKIKIQITLFGPGGSYLMPDTVIIRCVTGDDIKHAVTNIAHEIIHLIIEKPIIERLQLSQKEKENLVNSIFEEEEFKKVFPKYSFPSYYRKPQKNLKEFF